MTHLWRYQAERRPVVLVADDLHWTDPASIALLKHLLPLCNQVPLLLLFILRPDRETPGWELRQTAEDARRTLQMASVIGRSFYYRVLARIVELTEELDSQLLTLQQADMIREAGRVPEWEYIFRHALTQEAAYSTLLLKQRRVFHRQVGEALEALFPDQSDELAGELADQALALAGELNDQEAEAKVLWGLLLVEHWGGGDIRKALDYGQRSLAITRRLGLKEQMGYTLTNLLMVYLNLEDLDAAREAGREAREIWRQLGNTPMLADNYNSAMWIELVSGDYDAALEMGREGKRLGQTIGSIWGQAGALNSMAVAYVEKGDLGMAIGSLTEARRLAKEADMHPLIYFGLSYLALAYLTAGAFERADRVANQLYAERDSLIQVYLRTSMAVSAEVKIRMGHLELAGRILWQILWELSRLELAAGNSSAAILYKQNSQEIVTYIANHTNSEELRASFLSLPEVQSLLAK